MYVVFDPAFVALSWNAMSVVSTSSSSHISFQFDSWMMSMLTLTSNSYHHIIKFYYINECQKYTQSSFYLKKILSFYYFAKLINWLAM